MLSSCNKKDNAWKHVDLDQKVCDLNETGTIESKKIIRLQTLDSCLIRKITKAIFYKNRLYILDEDQQKVFIFSDNGKFIKVIYSYGRGPKEYIQLCDIFINNSDNTLNLLSRTDYKLFVYDLDGGFVQIRKLPVPFLQRMIFVNDYYVGYAGNYVGSDFDNNNIWFFDKDFKIISSTMPIRKKFNSRFSMSVRYLSKYNDIVNYIQMLDYNVYSYKNKEYNKKKYLYLGKYECPEHERNFDNLATLCSKYVTSFDFIQETDMYYIIGVVYKYQSRLIIINKKSNSYYFTNMAFYTKDNDVTGSHIVGNDSKNLILYCSTGAILYLSDENNMDSEKDKEKARILKRKFPDVKESDNPFIVIYRIKDK